MIGDITAEEVRAGKNLRWVQVMSAGVEGVLHLWKFENVIITPHVAGQSDKIHARMVNTVKENIRRFVEAKPLINVVDKQKGY